MMEKLDEALNLLTKLYLEKLNPDWVKNVIESDFTEVEDIPLDFEDVHSSTNFTGLFNAILSSLRECVDSVEHAHNNSIGERRSLLLHNTSDNEEEHRSRSIYSSFWLNMSQTLNLKTLLSFLFYYIYRGHRYDANESTRELGSQAASTYFLLLAIPGSNAFRVFHPVLYLKTLDLLRLTTKLNIGASSPKKGNPRGSRLSRRKSTDENFEGNDDEDTELSFLSPAEASKLIRILNILMNDFLRLIKRFSLKHSPESLDETVAILVEVTRCEIHNPQGVFLNRHGANTPAALAYNAYVALQNLCDNLHGIVQKTVLIIMKYIMNNILMISRGSSDLSARALGVIREHSVIFVKYLLIQLENNSHAAVYVLVQNLCCKVPDKADFRDKTAKSVVEILKVLPLTAYLELLRWLFKFSHNEKAGHRLFTLEVIAKLLSEDERQADSGNTAMQSRHAPAESDMSSSDEDVGNILNAITVDHDVSTPTDRNLLSHKFLLSIIFSRCRDSATTVRAKALILLAECTISTNPTILKSMKEIFFQSEPVIFTTPHIPNNGINCESPQEELDKESVLPNADVVMSMLKRRALDERVTVRKSALQVMANIMKINNQMLIQQYFSVLLRHCRDSALVIRKQMISSLSSVVETYPEREDVIDTWVTGILPLILDPEIKVQEKVVEHTDLLLFRRINIYGETVDDLPWKILNAVTQHTLHKFFTKVMMMWAKSEYLRSQLTNVCKTHIGHEFNEQTWMLLAMLSQYVTIKDSSFAVDYFEENYNLTDEVGAYTIQQVLKFLCHTIKCVPAERARSLRDALLAPVINRSVNVELISPILDTVVLITYTLEGENENGQKAIETWAAPILNSCDEYLKAVLFPLNPGPLSKDEEDVFFRQLFTLGEVALFCPSKVNKRMFLMLQSIVFHQNHTNKCTEEPPVIPSTQTQSSQPPAVTFTPTRRLKALAVVTLGKMCLQHEDQAKSIIPALGKMLDTTSLPSFKINILFVLSDMCVRYATLVDPLMPQVTACLRDDDIQVRRTALTLLISLLQEDYLKLKGSFFYRILQCLLDDHEDIRSTVIFYMTERLLKRFPKIFLQHFIECIFHYNCYEEHESYNRFTQTKQEKELFSLAGQQFRGERMELYRFMLDHMPDDQRFATTQRLCQDVLGGVVDGRIKLTVSSLPMLEDTFMVLSCEDIKLATLKSRLEENEQPTDQAEQAEMAGNVIKKTIISQVVKRNVIECIVPILIALKQKLAEQRSSLMKQLLLYFKEIMKDYRNEVREILAGDKQFAKEIEFDLRKLEEQQQQDLEEQKKTDLSERRSLNHVDHYSEASDHNKIKLVSLGSSPKLIAGQAHATNNSDASQLVSESKNEAGGDSLTTNPIKSPAPDTRPSSRKTKSTCGSLLKQVLISRQKTADKMMQSNKEMDGNETDSSGQTDENMDTVTSMSGKIMGTNLENEIPGYQNVDDRETDNISKIDAKLRDEKALYPQETKTALSSADTVQGNENLKYSVHLQRTDKNHSNSAQSSNLASQEESMSSHHLNEVQQIAVAKHTTPTLCQNTGKDKLPHINSESLQQDRITGSVEPQITIALVNQKTPKVNKRELLRAISTPQPNQKVINDITFINRTQEISAIGISISQTSSTTVEDISNSKTMLLHFRSPEAFSKEDEFSKLRKSSKRSLTSEFKETVSEKGKKNVPERKPLRETSAKETVSSSKAGSPKRSGGFMESYAASDHSYAVTSDLSSDDSDYFLPRQKSRQSNRRGCLEIYDNSRHSVAKSVAPKRKGDSSSVVRKAADSVHRDESSSKASLKRKRKAQQK